MFVLIIKKAADFESAVAKTLASLKDALKAYSRRVLFCVKNAIVIFVLETRAVDYAALKRTNHGWLGRRSSHHSTWQAVYRYYSFFKDRFGYAN